MDSESDGTLDVSGPLFDTSPVPTLVHEPTTGDILDVNPACEDLFGYERSTLRKLSVSEFTNGIEDAAERAAAAFEQTMETGEQSFDWEIERPDGSRAEVSVELRRATDDGADRILAFVTDVTDRRKRKRILDELQAVAASMMDARTPEQVAEITVDAAQGIMDFALASVRLRSGMDLEMAAMTTATEGVYPNDPPTYAVGEGFVGEAFEAGEIQHVEGIESTPAGDLVGGVECALCVPLGTHGVFTVGGENPGQFDSTDVEFATLLTRLTESALDQIDRERRFEARTNELETLLNNAPIVFYQLDPEGVIVESRGRALESLGLEPNEVVGQSIFDLYEDYPKIHELAERALAGEPVNGTVEIGDLWFESSYQPVVEAGELDRVIGVAVDISEQKQIERQFSGLSDASVDLSESETRAEAIQQTMDIAKTVLGEQLVVYWEHDGDGNLVACNVSDDAEMLVGGPDADLAHSRGDPIWDVYAAGRTVVDNDFDPDNAADAGGLRSTILSPVGDHGLVTVGNTEPDAYDETNRHLLSTLSGILRTTLDRLSYEHELVQKRAELERSNENLQQFAYIASHDLQEPLRMVASYVDLLEKEYSDDLDDEAREYMDFAVDGAHRMQAMVDGLLQYARVETRGDDPEPVDPNRVLAATLESLQFRVEETNASVDAESIPAVKADASQLGQLFQNLIENAMTYANDDEPRIEVSARTDDDWIEISVSDDGPGIPERYHDRIFEVFERGESTDEDGTGIGLSVCQRIVSRHDGDIWVDDEDGAGTTIQFTLPRATEVPADV